MAIVMASKDVKPRHLVGGHWAAARLLKGLRNKSEKSGKRGRTHIARPPKTGWPGGRPEDNGYRG